MCLNGGMEELLSSLEQYILENFDRDDNLICKGLSIDVITKREEAPVPIIHIKKPIVAKQAPPVAAVEAEVAEPIIQAPKIEKAKSRPEFFAIYGKIAPNVVLHKEPCSDALAKHVKLAWKDQKDLPSIPIFIDKSQAKFSPFLSQIARAISDRFSKAAIYDISEIEEQNRYGTLFGNSSLKLIIIPEATLLQSINLLPYYKEVSKKKYIAHLRALVLPNLTQMERSPKLKQGLWKALLELLA